MNPYFRNATKDTNQEYDIYNRATDELIEIYGRNFSYLKKTIINPDYVLGEDLISQFNSAIPLTFLIENFEEYGGQGDVFSKFGLTMDDTLTLIIQQDRFFKFVQSKPQIGDLLYDSTSNRIFEISYVNFDDSFNQFLGENMSYKLKTKLYKYSHETLNTGINNVDSVGDEDDSNTSDEITQMNDRASEIIDFDEDFFGNQ